MKRSNPHGSPEWSRGIAAGMLVILTAAAPLAADELSMTSVKDNTLIEDPSLALSAGASSSFYSGRVGSNGGNTLRRGVIAFDIAGVVPEGSTITAVTLTLRCSKVPSGSAAQLIKLQRMLADWGEGNSVAFGGGGAPATPGSATWVNRFHPTDPWTTPGGDFSSTVSGSVMVGAVGNYTFASTAAMVADVQAWLDDPANNFGWAVIGNETTPQQIRRFDTHESALPAWRPNLVITFEPPSTNPYDLNGDETVNGADLAILLSEWGEPGPADFNGDGTVGGADLTLLLAAWGL